MVKADGYGHGATQVARAALEAGAVGLAVTTTEEAAELFEAGFGARTLVMGPVLHDQLEEAIETGAEIAVWSPQFVGWAGRAAQRSQRRVRLHLKVDTGMHRLGMSPEELPDMFDAVAADPWLEPAAVMTHFATADDDPEFLEQQIELFDRTVGPQRRAHPEIMVHAANSAATLAVPRSHYDGVRCGLALYGMSPFQRDPDLDDLSPAMTLSSYVASLKDIEPGQGVSYSWTAACAWRAPSPTRVALIPLGYGDGFFRLLSDRGDVLIGGRRYPRVGRVCMDQFMVEVGRGSPVAFGDHVVLMGRQGDERVTAEELAGHVGTINYEMTCSLTSRVKREYVGGIQTTGECT